MNILPIRAFSAAALLLILAGCVVRATPPLSRIALLAPFEGADRAVGYEALYGARLALAETADLRLELLPIDVGHDQAGERLAALAGDPLVRAVILAGVDLGEPVTQSALGDLPALVLGIVPAWGAGTITAVPADTPPTVEFIERYLALDQFAPVPGPLALSAYSAMGTAIDAAQSTSSRAEMAQAMSR